jgi:hypothetical protein
MEATDFVTRLYRSGGERSGRHSAWDLDANIESLLETAAR